MKRSGFHLGEVVVVLGSNAAHNLLAVAKVLELRSNVGGVLDPVRVGTFTPWSLRHDVYAWNA
jgi:hypothetical protein